LGSYPPQSPTSSWDHHDVSIKTRCLSLVSWYDFRDSGPSPSRPISHLIKLNVMDVVLATDKTHMITANTQN
jgi:hypothetical protein